MTPGTVQQSPAPCLVCRGSRQYARQRVGMFERLGSLRMSKIGRLAALAVTGGCLFQLVGCASGFAPIVLSITESLLFQSVLGRFVAP